MHISQIDEHFQLVLYLQKDLKQFLFHTAKLVFIKLEGEKNFKCQGDDQCCMVLSFSKERTNG